MKIFIRYKDYLNPPKHYYWIPTERSSVKMLMISTILDLLKPAPHGYTLEKFSEDYEVLVTTYPKLIKNIKKLRKK